MGAYNYYAVLGVNRREGFQGIQSAYRKLAKECHPDDAGMQGKEKFQAIQEAYEVLSDPGKSEAYDASIYRRHRIGVGAEPLVPSHHPSRSSYPEPFTSLSSPTEHISLRRGVGFPCPFCQAFDS